MKNIFIIAVLILLISCTQNKKENNTTAIEAQNAIEVVGDSPKTDNNVSFNKVINETKIKSTPLEEATNFDSFIDAADYNDVNIEVLQLKKLYPNFHKETHNFKAIASYKLAISKDFYTVVVTILKGENEMESVLINYDLEGKIIDSKVISYDEIAEGQSKIESKIEDNKLTIDTIFWVDEKQVTTEVFVINSDGKINQSSAKEISLIDNVIHQLNLDTLKIKKKFISSKVQPNDSNETIVVIPEIALEDDDNLFELNSYIVLVNNSTAKITHTYYESYKTNGWTSDAIELKEIGIDTAPYIVATNTRAFGIRVYHIGMSKANPYSNKNISLFIKSDNTLKKVLHNYDVMDYGGEWDTDCYGEFVDVKKLLIIDKEKTNGYFDIKVKSKTTKTKNIKDENGDCDAIDSIKNETSILKFDGEVYKK